MPNSLGNGAVSYLFLPNVWRAVALNHLPAPRPQALSLYSPSSCCPSSLPSWLGIYTFCGGLATFIQHFQMFREEGEPSHLISTCCIAGTHSLFNLLKSYFFILLPKNSFTQLIDGSLVFFPPQQENWFPKTNAPFPYPDYYV